LGIELLADDSDLFCMPTDARVTRNADVVGWTPVFRAAWMLLAAEYPEIAAEVGALARVIVPLRTPPRGGVDSSTSQETFGAIALSEPLDPVTLAETLTHEVQHLKLSALLDMVQLTRMDDGERFYAPWRDDPRPASGLLQGTYAHLGIVGFWHRRPRGDEKFARWREAAASGADTLLSSGQLTAAGGSFVSGMAATLAEWSEKQVDMGALRRATAANAAHRERWLAAYGEPAG
jgi:HEXXH motif-containing protein